MLTKSPIAEEETQVEFFAGAAEADITPDVPKRAVPLNGYGARKQAPATGVHDRIYAKALVIESRDANTGKSSRAAIVTTDLCMVNQFMRNEILAQVKDIGISDSNLMLTASHTHSAPAALDPRWLAEEAMGKFDKELFDETNARIAGAIREAAKNLAPASFGISQGQFPELVRNRRVPGYSYETRRFAPNAGTKPVDATMSVMSVKRNDGAPIAALVVFGSHATILGPDNMLISADWPGVMQRELKNKIGGEAVVMFANGAEGDQAPVSTDEQDDFRWMEWYGLKVTDAAMSLWNSAQNGDVAVAAAASREKLPRVHLKMFLGIPLPKPLTNDIATDALSVAIRIGPAVLVGIPGEPVHNVGNAARKSASELGVKNPVIIGLANDWIGYITDPEVYKEGGYEASATLFGKNESEVILKAAMSALKQIQR